MTDDRVAKLESRVRELEATLNGLTDELVDTKDRLETVEEAVAGDETPSRRADIVEGELLGEGQDAAGHPGGSDGDSSTERESDTDTGAETGAETDTEAADAEEADGIIVA